MERRMEVAEMVTADQVSVAIGLVAAVGEAIAELGEVPSGHLYTALTSARGININDYNRIIDVLINARLVKRTNSHLLIWVGPRPIPRKVVDNGGRPAR